MIYINCYYSDRRYTSLWWTLTSASFSDRRTEKNLPGNLQKTFVHLNQQQAKRYFTVHMTDISYHQQVENKNEIEIWNFQETIQNII